MVLDKSTIAELLDRLGTAACEGGEVAGLSISVARDGAILYARGFGVRGAGEAAALDADTIFPIGSITKQFTAAAIQLLALDGKLSIDERVAAYTSDVPHADALTIRNLLVQTSGLASYTAEPDFLSTLVTSTSVTPRELLATVAHKPLAFIPNSRFEYSNTNYVALGAIIDAVEQVPYAQVIRERIAEPLGLTTLAFGVPGDIDNAVRTPWTPQATYAAGALCAAPADLVRWDQAFFGGTLVSPEVVVAMTTPPALPDAPGYYAFGWLADSIDGRRRLSHSGGVAGASTSNSWFPDRRIAVVVCGNSLDFDPGSVVRDTMRVVDPPSPEVLAAASASASGEDPVITERARSEYAAWMNGCVDLARYDDAMRAALSPAAVDAMGKKLAALGAPSVFIFKGRRLAGAASVYRYRVEAARAPLLMTIAYDAAGRIAGLFFAPAP